MLNQIKRMKWLYIALFFIALNQTIIFGFTDLDADDPDTLYIEQLEERGLTNGYPDGTFRPEASITRSELIALVNRAFKFETAASEHEFEDVSSDQWFEEHVRIAVKEGYINGYPDKTFRPYKVITRGEVAAILSRIMALEPVTYHETADDVDSWVFDDVQSMLEVDIMSMDDSGAFNARTPITRGEVATSLIKALLYEEELAALEDETIAQEGQENVPSSGGGANPGSGAGGGAGGGSGNGGDSKLNPSSEVVYALNVVSDGFDDIEDRVYYNAKKLDSTQMDIIKDVHSAVDEYLKDYSYDYDGAMNPIRVDINALSEEKKEQVKLAIKEAIPMQYEDLLRDFFKIYEEV